MPNCTPISSSQPGRARGCLISVVVPVFNEQGNLHAVAAAVEQALAGETYELIFVDDGSTDGTYAEIESLAAASPAVRGLSLSRNFGHQYALAAGLKAAAGEAVIMMDGDMQHPPALLPELLARWREGYNVVQAVRRDTAHVPYLKRLTSKAFYKCFSALCGIPIEPGMADFRLLDRTVLDEINAMQEGQLFLRGLIAWMGYRRALVGFEVGQRHSGRSKYSVRRMLKFAKAGIFAFSSIPLRIGVTVGLVMSALSFAELAFVLVAYLARWETVPGWASIVGITSLLFGVLFLVVGIQGEYIIRIYERVQRRPAFLVERAVGKPPAPSSAATREKNTDSTD